MEYIYSNSCFFTWSLEITHFQLRFPSWNITCYILQIFPLFFYTLTHQTFVNVVGRTWNFENQTGAGLHRECRSHLRIVGKEANVGRNCRINLDTKSFGNITVITVTSIY